MKKSKDFDYSNYQKELKEFISYLDSLLQEKEQSNKSEIDNVEIKEFPPETIQPTCAIEKIFTVEDLYKHKYIDATTKKELLAISTKYEISEEQIIKDFFVNSKPST